MIRIVDHLRIQRILLLALGLWPYNQSKFVQFQLLLFFIVSNSFIIFQLTSFLTSECTVDFIVKLLSIVSFFLACTAHYIAFWINMYTVKHLMDRLQHACNELKDENEIAIMKKYANSAERIAIVITSLTVCALLSVTLMPLLPRILSTFLLVNISGPLYTKQFVTEYFVDKEKNFYLILLHTCASFYIGVIAFSGGGLVGCAFLKHICGLFSIASYRIEQVMKLNIHEKTDVRRKEMEIEKKIICAVDIHRTAIELSELFISSFEGPYFCGLVVVITSLCLNLYEVFQTALIRDKIEEFILHFGCAGSLLIYSFLGNSCGEEITEHYNDMFSYAYTIRWYTAPIHIQKMILFLLQRSCKPYGLKLGGIFIASLEGFASLSTTSVSYFTVIYSTQK
ncbi:ObirOr5-9E30 [Ooceraea biroi]|uniref:Odorant receptor n=2 Tax=Ooceraea biroi TaxID=2015173 RepID=A0A3L8DZ24_OOCBI|nr:ObirOr5-9E30 [Ooceraea biroi]